MDELADFLSNQNRTILRVVLSGHGKNPDSTYETMTGVSRLKWLSEVGASIEAAKKMAGGQGTSYSLVGFSLGGACLLYTSPRPRDRTRYRMSSSA